ncbi:hypothetical protein RJP21_05000 [Paenibacillus sp. VCA1]|uniref:hypothetical protein n=1 Tax=Paenibacillus sp. VCA1 TaxID=3039148 RepID=UPI002871B3B7|nr:hypothetical protein [Paenibacillus sp. VCA1]MDR9852957.1 hypothetical protein [Paenibacillus sp. VCA1]
MTTETRRDLAADMTICEAATPGPWIRRAEFDRAIAKEYTLDDVVSAEGGDMCHVVIEPSNERFIIEAREGWPHAIRRALAAEAEVTWLKDSMRRLNGVHDEQCARSAEYYAEIKRLRMALEATQFHLYREQYMSATDTVDSALEVSADATS